MSYNTRITFRLKQLEKERILERARLEGISPAHLFRSIVDGYLIWLIKQGR
jgi:hypothetical protein